jgi:hypothetical protein
MGLKQKLRANESIMLAQQELHVEVVGLPIADPVPQ